MWNAKVTFFFRKALSKACQTPLKLAKISKWLQMREKICKKIKKTLAFYITLCYIVFALSA